MREPERKTSVMSLIEHERGKQIGDVLVDAYRDSAGNMRAACRLLGYSRTSVYEWFRYWDPPMTTGELARAVREEVRMKEYLGMRDDTGTLGVVVIPTTGGGGGALDPRLDLRDHSPTGFECGYLGSGPAQLALAILADATDDDQLACRRYLDYKAAVIATLPGPASNDRSAWKITQWAVLAWCARYPLTEDELAREYV
jgi:hypothetical protein